MHFFDIPLEFWNPKGLSFIASLIGKPLHVDQVMETCCRMSYARVCIEVSADKDFIHDFDLEVDDELSGSTVSNRIHVEYQWTPLRCKKCSSFGHDCFKTVHKPVVTNPNRHTYSKRKGVWKVVSVKDNVSSKGWTVVNRKDKGKKVADGHPSHSSGGRPLGGPKSVSNMFSALSRVVEETDPIDRNVVDAAHTRDFHPSNVRADSSCHPSLVPDREAACDTLDVEGDDIVEDFDVGYDEQLQTPESSMSSRQRKKEAKMKFSGSRPKGRHRP